MEGLRFRRAQSADLSAIIRLLADDALGQTREQPGPPPSPKYEAAFRAIDEDPNQLLAVADQNDEVVGCLQLTFVPASRARAPGEVRSKACV